MNYNTDRAIKNIEEDLLGRAPFSEVLGRAIYEYKGKDSLVIGLYGKWGSGKTSVANMALQKVEEMSRYDDNKPLVIRFSPWNYSDKDNLICRFFMTIRSRIISDKNDELRNRVGKALIDYSSIFDFASLIPVVGKPVASLAKNIAQKEGDALAKSMDIEKLKEELGNALLEEKQRIIILIDDIDRLTNSQIRDIFQLVKQVGDLDNITYILAMDREVVRRALDGVHNTDGNEYLEKIIQISFELPEVKKSKMIDIFVNKIQFVLDGLPRKIEWDQGYWNKIFSNCILPYLQTVRDINRIINSFQFRYGMLYEETAFEDMIAITTLEVLQPDLYKWIAENKENICGYTIQESLEKNRKDDCKKKYEIEFQNMGLNSEKAIRSVSAIFPVFAKKTDTYFYEDENSTNIRKKMRAAQAERFDLYFCFDMDTIKVPRNTINRCVYTMDKKELKSTIFEINQNGNIDYFIDDILSMINDIPNERLIILASAFIDVSYGFEDNYDSLLSIPTAEKARYCLEKMVYQIENEEDRFTLYKQVLTRCKKDSLGTIALEIWRLKNGKGCFLNVGIDKEIISLEHMKTIENKYLYKIKEVSKSYDLINIKGFLNIYYLWEDLNKEDAQNYLNNALLDDVKKLRFLCNFAGRWSGTKGSGWDFEHSHYTDYLSGDDAYRIIGRMNKKKIDLFSEVEQVKLASFYLNYQKDDMDLVDEKLAKKQVEKWRKKT